MTYLPFILLFLPDTLFGFNWTGWAWILMLLVTLFNLTNTRGAAFPLGGWLPWMIYLVACIIYNFSFLGLQLTLQYLLPLLIGVVASGFSYSEEKLLWLFQLMIRLCGIAMIITFGSLLFRGYTPAEASTPMMLSVAASLMAGIFFMTKSSKYFFYFGLLFLFPFITVTRMAIAAFLAIFILHFANSRIADKILYGLIGSVIVIIVFNSKGFQEKTFGENKGKLSDLSVNYYENQNIQLSGRNSLKMALEPGLLASPVWGNGPRADLERIFTLTGLREAHNDYLSVQYNYGYVGLVLLLFGFGTSFFALLGLLKHLPDAWSYLLATSTLTLFISFLMFMYSDNILKYTIYFPDFFFAMIGIVFSIHKKGLESETILELEGEIG